MRSIETSTLYTKYIQKIKIDGLCLEKDDVILFFPSVLRYLRRLPIIIIIILYYLYIGRGRRRCCRLSSGYGAFLFPFSFSDNRRNSYVMDNRDDQRVNMIRRA